MIVVENDGRQALLRHICRSAVTATKVIQKGNVTTLIAHSVSSEFNVFDYFKGCHKNKDYLLE